MMETSDPFQPAVLLRVASLRRGRDLPLHVLRGAEYCRVSKPNSRHTNHASNTTANACTVLGLVSKASALEGSSRREGVAKG